MARPNTPVPSILWILAAILAGIEIILSLADAGYVGDMWLRSRAYCLGAFWPEMGPGSVFSRLCSLGGGPLYPGQQVLMFLSHAFLHGSLLHMVMNTTILLALGRFVGDRYGPRAILPVFMIGALAGGAVFGLLGSSSLPMVGASGAVFAFLGVWIAWDWRRHRAAGASPMPVARQVAVLVAINVGMYVWLDGTLAWEAHLGGFVAGLALGWWLEGRVARAALARAAEVRRMRGH